MGYSTNYTLAISALPPEVQEAPISIKDVLHKLQTKNPSKEELIADLMKVSKPEMQVDPQTIMEDLRASIDSANYAFDEDGETADSCKWYDHEIELQVFSKKYPNYLFTLAGSGEESGDLWKKYIVNGKIQVAKARIIIDDFDIKLLKS